MSVLIYFYTVSLTLILLCPMAVLKLKSVTLLGILPVRVTDVAMSEF